jgi:hypothetical protein
VGRPEGKRPVGTPRYRREIRLKWILKKWDAETWLRIETSCESGNEPSGSIKCREFFD